jgi:hypothetical protein
MNTAQFRKKNNPGCNCCGLIRLSAVSQGQRKVRSHRNGFRFASPESKKPNRGVLMMLVIAMVMVDLNTDKTPVKKRQPLVPQCLMDEQADPDGGVQVPM